MRLPASVLAEAAVKDFFLVQVGSLLTPPTRRLDIQAHTVDVRPQRSRSGQRIVG